MIRFIFALFVYCSLVQVGLAAPVLKQEIFEFNSRVKIQEEFLILSNDTVSDPSYSLNELRMQLDANKTYEQIGFLDQVNTTYGKAVAYNTLDVRWRKFKNKLLYFANTTASASKYEVIPFRVINPAGEVSEWGQIRLSLGGQYDANYDYYPKDDIASAFASQPVNINVLQNDPNVQAYYAVEIYGAPANGTVLVNADKTVQYTPVAGFTGQDRFSYRVAGNNLYDVYSASATVTVYVQSPNNPPQISGTPATQVYAGQAVVFKILCHFIKLSENEMTHDQPNFRYASSHSGIT